MLVPLTMLSHNYQNHKLWPNGIMFLIGHNEGRGLQSVMKESVSTKNLDYFIYLNNIEVLDTYWACIRVLVFNKYGSQYQIREGSSVPAYLENVE